MASRLDSIQIKIQYIFSYDIYAKSTNIEMFFIIVLR